MTTKIYEHENAIDVFVKEEKDLESPGCLENTNNAKIEQIDFLEPTSKCGEVLVACTGKFTFVCILCSEHFTILERFGVHIKEQHLKFNLENEETQAEDPLCTSAIQVKILPDTIENTTIEDFELSSEMPTDTEELDKRSESPILVEIKKEVGPHEEPTAESTPPNLVGNKYICDLCGRTYLRRRSYQAHIKKAHIKGQKLFKPLKFLKDIPALNLPIDEVTCKYCDEQFKDTETLQAHLTTHTGRKRFVCRFCRKTFSCRTTRLQHLSTHTGERHYKCPHCPKTFSGKSNLTSHIRAHLKIKNYSCDYCDKRFVQSSEKKVHELTHTGEKPHQCEECGQRYPTSNKLNEHLRRHKNIKNYKCEICGKAFYGLNLLKNHMPTHTGEKPFSCNICGQSFPRMKSLKTHEQLHSGEKNYVCNKCGKAFAQFAGLYSHMKSHGGKPG